MKARQGLPVAELHRGTLESATGHFATTTVDAYGRVSDRSALRFLGWRPGHSIAFRLTNFGIEVTGRSGSTCVLNRQGHLHVPLAIRRACRLDPGDRLLLGAFLESDLLVMFTTPELELMIRHTRPLQTDGMAG